jgi:ADP-L-glycero-D-manno-heptose 6-epimerase
MIVVTGAAGFIGSAMVWKLNREGVSDILAVDESGRDDAEGPLSRLRASAFRSKGDFLEQVLADSLPDNVDAIIHMGACSATTERDEAYLQRNNTDYSRHLAEWCLSHDARYLYASSAATYGDGSLGFSDSDDLTPRLQPLNPYGRSKLRFDQWVLDRGLQNRLAGFRFFNVFGPNEYRKGGMVSGAYRMFNQVREQGYVSLFDSANPEYGHGEQERDFVSVSDCVEVLWWFLQHPEANGIFNVGTGQARTWNDLANAVFTAMGREPDIRYVPLPEALKASYQYHTQADLTRLRAVGCDVPFRSLERGVSEYVREHLMQPDPWLRSEGG